MYICFKQNKPKVTGALVLRYQVETEFIAAVSCSGPWTLLGPQRPWESLNGFRTGFRPVNVSYDKTINTTVNREERVHARACPFVSDRPVGKLIP